MKKTGNGATMCSNFSDSTFSCLLLSSVYVSVIHLDRRPTVRESDCSITHIQRICLV